MECNIEELIMKMTSEKRHMDFNIKFHNISNEEIISKEKKQALHLGWINRYEYTRGYGFISDLYDNKSYFFHITSLGKEFFSSEYTNNSEEVKEHLVKSLVFDYNHERKIKPTKSKYHILESDGKHTKIKTRYGIINTVNNEYGNPIAVGCDLNGFPYLQEAQIVCFYIEDENAIDVHKPELCINQLITNCHTDKVWNLLLNLLPTFCFDLYYEGYETTTEVYQRLEFYKTQARTIYKKIKAFDIGPYKQSSNYEIHLRNYYFPSTKEDDLNQFYLELSYIGPKNDDEFITKHFHTCHYLTSSFFWYGQASLRDALNYMSDKEREIFDKVCGYGNDNNACMNNILEAYKEKLLNYIVESYSINDHFMYHLSNMKTSFCHENRFLYKGVIQNIKKKDKIVFTYPEDINYHDNKLEFIFDNNKYQLFTFDPTYEGRYRGKHYIGSVKIDSVRYTPDYIIKCFNEELQMYISNLFDESITSNLAEIEHEL